MKQEIPKDLLCPISREIMVDPVMACDGHTYDRASIEPWFKKHSTSPNTGAQLENTDLIPNYTVRKLVDPYLSSEQFRLRYLTYQQKAAEEKFQVATGALCDEEGSLQAKYPDAYKKLKEELGYKPASLVNPFSAHELDCVLCYFESFEKLVNAAAVSLIELGDLDPVIRLKIFKEMEKLVGLILEAKIPLCEIISILSGSDPFSITVPLFIKADFIIELVKIGFDWETFSNLDITVIKEILFSGRRIPQAITELNMPLDSFFKLSPQKMCAFLKSLYSINHLVRECAIDWAVIFELTEHDYNVIHGYSSSMSGLLKKLGITLGFFFLQSKETLDFIHGNAGKIGSLHEKVISIQRLVELKKDVRDYVVCNQLNMVKLVYYCKIQITEILDLNKKDRNLLVENAQIAYKMYQIWERGSDPIGDDNHVSLYITALKRYRQPDGTINLGCVQAKPKAAPEPQAKPIVVVDPVVTTERTQPPPAIPAYQSRYESFSDDDSRPKIVYIYRKNAKRDRMIHLFLVVSACLSPITASVGGISIAALSGASSTSAGVFGAMVGLTQAIPVGGQVALAAVFAALALVGLGYAGYRVYDYFSRNRYYYFPWLRPDRPYSNLASAQRPLLP